MLPSLPRIELAARSIDPCFLHSPQSEFEPLSRELGVRLTLKVETVNPIRSFKGRGTDWFVRNLPDSTPLVCASAGNFGQGLAYAARAREIPLRVFAAENANPLKVARMRELGAEITLAGHDFDAAKDAAREYATCAGHRYVEDGRELEIAEGAGTIAVELLAAMSTPDAVAVPVGNGALINGMGAWIKHNAPRTKVIGVCAAGAPAMERSWRARKPIATAAAETIADGIGVRVPVPEAVEIMPHVVDDIVLVDDAAILRAMRLLLLHTGLLVEPAGAAGVAAILAHRERFAGQTAATLLCGSNVTAAQFQEWFAVQGS